MDYAADWPNELILSCCIMPVPEVGGLNLSGLSFAWKFGEIYSSLKLSLLREFAITN